MNQEPTFGDYLKAAFHFTIPVPGVGGIPVNYLFIGLAIGTAIAYWPFLMFGVAGEILYLMVASSHPRFQRAIRARLLQMGKKAAEETLEEIVGQLQTYRRSYYDFCQKCDAALKIGHDTFAANGKTIADSYHDNIQQFKMIMARMLRMREVLEANIDPEAEAKIRQDIADIESKIADSKQPDATRDSQKSTLEILNRRLAMQTQIGDQLSHVTAEVDRLNQEILLVRDQTIANSSSASGLSDRITVTAEIVQQHADWISDQRQFLQQIEVNQQSTANS